MVDSPNEIRHKSFTVVRRGFDRAAVRAFLDSAAAAVEAGHRIDNLLGLRRQAPFPTARRGFDQDEVRHYLNQLARGFQQPPIGSPLATTESPAQPADVELDVDTGDGDQVDMLAERPDDPEVFDEFVKNLNTPVDGEPEEADLFDSPGRLSEPVIPSVAEPVVPPPAADSDLVFDPAPVADSDLIFDPAPLADSGPVFDPAPVAKHEPIADAATFTPVEPAPAVPPAPAPQPVAPAAPAAFAASTSDLEATAPVLPPLPSYDRVDLDDVNVYADAAAGPLDIDEQAFQSAAADITTLMRQSHALVLRMRAEAEAKVRAAIDATDQEMRTRRDRETQQLQILRGQAEEQMQAALREAKVYSDESRQQAGRYLADTKAEADRYVEQRQLSTDAEADRLVSDADAQARVMIEGADDQSRKVRADADAYAARARTEATAEERRTLEAAEVGAAEMRDETSVLRQQAADTLAEARREADRSREQSIQASEQIVVDAHETAIARSQEVMEQARDLVATLTEVESETHTRLLEARRVLAEVVERTTVSATPDDGLAARIDDLLNRATDA